MCGIAGIAGASDAHFADAPALEATLRRLARELTHRGPDASGVVLSGRAGLAHTRLAIVDLTPTGAQPMRSPDGRHVLVFNGEVYNFLRLRAELEAKGERFAGRSDTEVVLRILVREGAAGLARLEGMFALALLEVSSGEVLLARDRVGQKPLYVAELTGGGFAFASELLPLLHTPGVDARVSPEALSYLLSFGFVPAPWTLRRGIRQLLPGCAQRLRPGRPSEEIRFAPEPGPTAPLLEGGEEELSQRLERVLSDTVRDHLVADVPIGVLLSGGVDSSTVAALAARHVGRLRTFCVVHRDPRYDESAAARAVASALGSDHHEIELPETGLSPDDLDTLVDHHGDPFADSSSLNVLRLAREMRRHVTVALSGDGGDEVFAGYPRFGLLRWISRIARLPRPVRQAAGVAAERLPGERSRQLARALRVADMPATRRLVAYSTLFWPEEQARLLRPEWRLPAAGADLDALLIARGAGAESDPVAAAHWMEQRLILPDEMLTKVDRMSMVAALEVRPPLVGDAVLDFASRLPFGVKHRGMAGKRVLRDLARRLVPSWVIDRPKQGFALPLLEHGGSVLDEATRFALEAEASPLRHFFEPAALADLARSLPRTRAGSDPEDSSFRRVHRRWLLVLLARALERHGLGA